MYVVVPTEAVLMVAGFHVPAILLFDVTGSVGGVAFWHKGPICVNVGAAWLVTTIAIVAVPPHWPAVGVKVYVVVPMVVVLIVAGFHVPLTPFDDVAGSAGGVLFWQSGPICVNVDTTALVTTMFMVVTLPHCPADGVNV